MHSGEYENALVSFEEAIMIRKHALGKDHPDVAVSMNTPYIQIHFLFAYTIFIHIEMHVSVFIQFTGFYILYNFLIQSSLVKVGLSHLLLRKLDSSLKDFQEAFYIRKNSLGGSHPFTAQVLNNIGCIHVEMGQLKKAHISFKNAMNVYRVASVSEPDNSALTLAMATTLCNIGNLYGFMNLFDKGGIILREASIVSIC